MILIHHLWCYWLHRWLSLGIPRTLCTSYPAIYIFKGIFVIPQMSTVYPKWSNVCSEQNQAFKSNISTHLRISLPQLASMETLVLNIVFFIISGIKYTSVRSQKYLLKIQPAGREKKWLTESQNNASSVETTNMSLFYLKVDLCFCIAVYSTSWFIVQCRISPGVDTTAALAGCVVHYQAVLRLCL